MPLYASMQLPSFRQSHICLAISFGPTLCKAAHPSHLLARTADAAAAAFASSGAIPGSPGSPAHTRRAMAAPGLPGGWLDPRLQFDRTSPVAISQHYAFPCRTVSTSSEPPGSGLRRSASGLVR